MRQKTVIVGGDFIPLCQPYTRGYMGEILCLAIELYTGPMEKLGFLEIILFV